jgi:hypothetical protein
MARLPQSDDIRKVRQGGATPGWRVGTDLGIGQVGQAANDQARAISGLGTSLQRAADSFEEQRLRNEAFDAKRMLLDFEQRARTEFEELKTKGPEAWKARYAEIANEFVGEDDSNLPRSQIDQIGLRLKEIEYGYGNQVVQATKAAADERRIFDLESGLQAALEATYGSPDEALMFRDDGLALIDAAPISARQKAKLKRTFREQVDQYAFSKRLEEATTPDQIDAVLADLDLETPGPKRYPGLQLDTRLRLRDSAEAQKRALFDAADRAEREAEKARAEQSAQMFAEIERRVLAGRFDEFDLVAYRDALETREQIKLERLLRRDDATVSDRRRTVDLTRRIGEASTAQLGEIEAQIEEMFIAGTIPGGSYSRLRREIENKRNGGEFGSLFGVPPRDEDELAAQEAGYNRAAEVRATNPGAKPSELRQAAQQGRQDARQTKLQTLPELPGGVRPKTPQDVAAALADLEDRIAAGTLSEAELVELLPTIAKYKRLVGE